jgi:hypothetical protein
LKIFTVPVNTKARVFIPTSIKNGVTEGGKKLDSHPDIKIMGFADGYLSNDLINWTVISDRITMPQGIRHGNVIAVTKAEFDHLNGA